MNISVRFFALYKDRAGIDNPTIELPEGATTSDLMDKLHSIYPNLPSSTTALIAINYQYSEPNSVLHDGDEVAIIPPVSGG